MTAIPVESEAFSSTAEVAARGYPGAGAAERAPAAVADQHGVAADGADAVAALPVLTGAAADAAPDNCRAREPLLAARVEHEVVALEVPTRPVPFKVTLDTPAQLRDVVAAERGYPALP